MSPEEADQHAIDSRRTLNIYAKMLADSEVQDGLLTALDAEVLLLEMLADHLPEKASKLRRLSAKWQSFRRRVQSRMN